MGDAGPCDLARLSALLEEAATTRGEQMASLMAAKQAGAESVFLDSWMRNIKETHAARVIELVQNATGVTASHTPSTSGASVAEQPVPPGPAAPQRPVSPPPPPAAGHVPLGGAGSPHGKAPGGPASAADGPPATPEADAAAPAVASVKSWSDLHAASDELKKEWAYKVCGRQRDASGANLASFNYAAKATLAVATFSSLKHARCVRPAPPYSASALHAWHPQRMCDYLPCTPP